MSGLARKIKEFAGGEQEKGGALAPSLFH